MHCHCNSLIPFSECCNPIISGKIKAKTAEQLMRSRYSAFVIADVDYLMRSHYKTTRPLKDKKNIQSWTKSVKWMGLHIISKKAGLESDLEAWVEFKATYIEQGKLECIHENSFFKQEKGIWYYVSGEHN